MSIIEVFYTSVKLEPNTKFRVKVGNDSYWIGAMKIHDGKPTHQDYIYRLLTSSKILQTIKIVQTTDGFMAVCEIKVFIRGK